MQLFTRTQCADCRLVARWLERHAVDNLVQVDVDTVDGAAESDFQDVLSTPTLIDDGGARYTGAEDIVRVLKSRKVRRVHT